MSIRIIDVINRIIKIIKMIKNKEYVRLVMRIFEPSSGKIFAYDRFYLVENRTFTVKMMRDLKSGDKIEIVDDSIYEFKKIESDLDINRNNIDLQSQGESGPGYIVKITNGSRCKAVTFLKYVEQIKSPSGYKLKVQGPVPYIYGTYIHPKYRMKGYFVNLYEAVFKYIQNSGDSCLYGEIHYLNRGSLLSHHKLGFNALKDVQFVSFFTRRLFWTKESDFWCLPTKKKVLISFIKKISRKQTVIPIVLGDSGLGFIRSLGEKGISSLVIDDGISSVRDLSKYCFRVFSSNFATAPDQVLNQLRELSEISHQKTGQLPILFPVSDYALEFIQLHWDTIAPLAQLSCPDRPTLTLSLDKISFYRWLKERGYPGPRTLFPSESAGSIYDDVDDLNFPCLLKPSLTYKLEDLLGVKLFVVQNKNEYEKSVDVLRKNKIPYVVQDIIPGATNDQFSFAGYCSDNGNILTYVMTNKIRQGFYGAGTFVSSAYVPELLDISTALLKELKYKGIFEIEFKRDSRDGQYKIIELNARSWAQVDLATRAGVNVAYCSYKNLVDGESMYYSFNGSGHKKYFVNLNSDMKHLKILLKNRDFLWRDLWSVLFSKPIITPFNLVDFRPGLHFLLHKLKGRGQRLMQRIIDVT